MAPPPKTTAKILYSGFILLTLFFVACLAALEWFLVQNRLAIRPLMADALPVSCQPSDENNNKLIHIDCPLRQLDTINPPATFSWNVLPYNGVFLEMKVEMYQWMVKPAFVGVQFGGDWSENRQESATYPHILYNGHKNPEFWPNIPGQGRQFSETVHAGGFLISKIHLQDFHDKTQLPLTDDGYYSPSAEVPPTAVTGYNTQVYDNALYTGDPHNPQIGDLRLTFWGSTATHVSAIGKQTKKGGRYYLVGVENVIHFPDRLTGFTSDVRAVDIVREGDFSSSELISQVLRERDGSPSVIWGVRLLVFCVTFAACAWGSGLVDRDKSMPWIDCCGGALGFCIFLLWGLIVFPIWCVFSVRAGFFYLSGALIGLLASLILWLRPRPAPAYMPLRAPVADRLLNMVEITPQSSKKQDEPPNRLSESYYRPL